MADGDQIRAVCDQAEQLLGLLRESVQLAGREWFSVADAAMYTGMSDKSIRRLIAAGKITPARPLAGKLLIERRQLDRMLRSSQG